MIYILVPVFKRLNKTELFLNSVQMAIKEPYKVLLIDDSPEYEHVTSLSQRKEVDVIKGTGDLYWGGG